MSETEDVLIPHTDPVGYSDLTSENNFIIRMIDVHKTLDGHKVLDGVNLDIKKGEIIAIIGGSGAGKTVTLKNIVGLMKPDKGTIIVNGIDISRSRLEVLEKVRKKIGFVFQGAALLNSLNVYDNIALPLREHEDITEDQLHDRVYEVLDLVGLKDAIYKMPSDLSGGMKKRAGLARAIVRNPEIILYDEPTSGLDPVKASIINELIIDMQKKLNVTSILVTHDMPSVFKVATRIAMLYNGSITKIGTSADFISSPDPIIQQFIKGESKGPITDRYIK